MRSFLALLFLLNLSAPSRAADDSAARELIDRAIRAHGGEDALARTKQLLRQFKGKMTPINMELPFTADLTAQLPERFKATFEVDAGGQKIKATLVLNGDKGWQTNGGAAMELTKPELEDLREEAYLLWLLTLVPLKEKGFELAALPDAKVDGKEVAGIKVARKDHGDVRLYFDKKTNLLAKVERKSREAGVAVDKEYFLSDYKDFEGVKVATRQIETLNGKKTTEVSLLLNKYPGKIEDSEFAKP